MVSAARIEIGQTKKRGLESLRRRARLTPRAAREVDAENQNLDGHRADGRRRTVKCQATPPPGISGHSTAGPQTLNVEGAQAQAVQQRVGVLTLPRWLVADPQTLAAHGEGQ